MHENDLHVRRPLERLDKSVSNTFSLQASNQAHSNQAILPPNKPNFIANIDSGIYDELIRETNKDYDPKEPYFEMPSF